MSERYEMKTGMPSTKRILIVDDHVMVRKGLIQILAESKGNYEVGEAGDESGLSEQLRRGYWDLLVLDITLPGKNGLVLLKQIRAQYPALPVLILTMHSETHYAVRALNAGARGYLTKERTPEELNRAVAEILNGGRYVTSPLAAKLNLVVTDEDKRHLPHENLSDREFEVLCHIGAGKSVSQVAQTMNLSVKTVSTYRARILEKMEMGNNADLIRYAIDNGLPVSKAGGNNDF